MCNKIKIGNFIAELNDKNEWIYKADESKIFTKTGKLKKVYRDLPRFRVIVDYEKQELDDFEQTIAEAVKDISIKLLSFSR